MATLLLIIIYLAFIGLGIPDSLFGTAWPAIYQEFGLPISAASCVTLLISGCTVAASLMSAWVINRFGTPKITAVSTAVTALALLGFSLSGNLLFLCLFAVPLGFGAGAIDAALNNYVALHYKATHMSFLHCFYGVGVSLSPYLMSIALADNSNWRNGYRLSFFIQLAIAIVTIVSLPLWKKAHPRTAEQSPAEKPKTLSLLQLARMPSVRAVWIIFLASCAIEFTCGTWGSTFLVNSKGMAVDEAAKAITLYYAGMALGRFCSGLAANRLSSWRIIFIGQGIVLAAIVLLFLPLPSGAAVTGLFLIGLGNGPLYPNLVHLTPQNFGRDISQSVMGSQMAAASIGIMLAPPLFGLLAERMTTGIFPGFLIALFVMMAAAITRLVTYLKKKE